MAGLETILESLLQRYERDEKKGEVSVRGMVAHNAGILTSVQGGAAMMLEAPLSFDPWDEYWKAAHRRFLVAYCQQAWKGRFFVPSSLRSVLLGVFTQMDAWATRTGFSPGFEYGKVAGEWTRVVDHLIEGAQAIPPLPEWPNVLAQTKAVELPPSASEHLVQFLRGIRLKEKKEAGFLGRLAFFPYCGATDPAALARNQRFWFGFAHTFTTTNAYRTAGSQYFAPLLQNTPTTVFVDALRAWRRGESPTASRLEMRAWGGALRDASESSVIVELWSFLNLHRAPIFNNRAQSAYDGLAGSIATHGVYPLVQGVGQLTRTWLASHDGARAELAALARTVVANGYPRIPPFALEHRARNRLRQPQPIDELYASDSVDLQLRSDLTRRAVEALSHRDELDEAAVALHLLLDADTYLKSLDEPAELSAGDDEDDADDGEGFIPGLKSAALDASTLQSALGARRVWLYSPGRQARFWPQDHRDALASIGWDELQDLRAFGSKEELYEAFAKAYEGKSSPHSVGACWNFGHEMAAGDTIVAKKGRRSFIGIGRVRGDYRFEPTRLEHKQVIGVDWLWSGQHRLEDVTLPMKTLTDVTRATEVRREIERLIASIAPEAAALGSVSARTQAEGRRDGLFEGRSAA